MKISLGDRVYAYFGVSSGAMGGYVETCTSEHIYTVRWDNRYVTADMPEHAVIGLRHAELDREELAKLREENDEIKKVCISIGLLFPVCTVVHRQICVPSLEAEPCTSTGPFSRDGTATDPNLIADTILSQFKGVHCSLSPEQTALLDIDRRLTVIEKAQQHPVETLYDVLKKLLAESED